MTQTPSLPRFLDLIYEEILLYHFPERVKWYESQIKAGKSLCTDFLGNVHASSVYDNEDDDYDENGL